MSTYRVEWSCCGSVTETESWEPEHCPFCHAPSQPEAAAVAEPLTAQAFDELCAENDRLIKYADHCNELIAAYKEAAQTAEPVAWIRQDWSGTGQRHVSFDGPPDKPSVRDELVNPAWTPLYAAPPQREPLPAGFRLVPVEPTREFVKKVQNHGVWEEHEVRNLYADILAALGTAVAEPAASGEPAGMPPAPKACLSATPSAGRPDDACPEEWCSVLGQCRIGYKWGSAPAREPLTDEQIDAIILRLMDTTGANLRNVARAIERAHGIKKGQA